MAAAVCQRVLATFPSHNLRRPASSLRAVRSRSSTPRQRAKSPSHALVAAHLGRRDLSSGLDQRLVRGPALRRRRMGRLQSAPRLRSICTRRTRQSHPALRGRPATDLGQLVGGAQPSPHNLACRASSETRATPLLLAQRASEPGGSTGARLSLINQRVQHLPSRQFNIYFRGHVHWPPKLATLSVVPFFAC